MLSFGRKRTTDIIFSEHCIILLKIQNAQMLIQPLWEYFALGLLYKFDEGWSQYQKELSPTCNELALCLSDIRPLIIFFFNVNIFYDNNN